MNYIAHYERLIERAPKEKPLDLYTEGHHIIPRCMGGADIIENIVFLTPEEHYVAHQLLVKIHPNNPNLVYAVVKMSGSRFSNNKLYGWVKKKLSTHKTKNRVVFSCAFCGVQKLVQPYYIKMFTYCSHKCRGAANKLKTEYLTHQCSECGIDFFDYKSVGTRKYCSAACKYKNEMFLVNLLRTKTYIPKK